MASLEGWGSAIELHPQKVGLTIHVSIRPVKCEPRYFVFSFVEPLIFGHENYRLKDLIFIERCVTVTLVIGSFHRMNEF